MLLIALVTPVSASIAAITDQAFLSGNTIHIAFDGADLSMPQNPNLQLIRTWSLTSSPFKPRTLLYVDLRTNPPSLVYDSEQPAQLRLDSPSQFAANHYTVSFVNLGDKIDATLSYSLNQINEHTSLENRYYGLRLSTESYSGSGDGSLYYGWLKLNYDPLTGAGNVTAAFNTTAQEGITVGQLSVVPESSSAVLVGLAGLAVLLRRRRVA